MGLKDYTDLKKNIHNEQLNESVKSINQWESVIHTSYDIVKAHGGK